MKKLFALLFLFSACAIAAACGPAGEPSQTNSAAASQPWEQPGSESVSSADPLNREQFNQLLGCHITRFESADITDEAYYVNAAQTQGVYSFTAIDGLEAVQAVVTLTVSKEAPPAEGSPLFEPQQKFGLAGWQQDGLYYQLRVDCEEKDTFLKWLSYMQQATSCNET